MDEKPVKSMHATYRANFEGFVTEVMIVEVMNDIQAATKGTPFNLSVAKQALKDLAAENGSAYEPKSKDIQRRYSKLLADTFQLMITYE